MSRHEAFHQAFRSRWKYMGLSLNIPTKQHAGGERDSLGRSVCDTGTDRYCIWHSFRGIVCNHRRNDGLRPFQEMQTAVVHRCRHDDGYLQGPFLHHHRHHLAPLLLLYTLDRILCELDFGSVSDCSGSGRACNVLLARIEYILATPLRLSLHCQQSLSRSLWLHCHRARIGGTTLCRWHHYLLKVPAAYALWRRLFGTASCIYRVLHLWRLLHPHGYSLC